MIKMIEDVRIDSEITPHTYELAGKAMGLAKRYGQSVQDAIQELMYLELLHREKKAKNLRGFLARCFYNQMMSRGRSDSHGKDYSKNFFSSKECGKRKTAGGTLQGYFTHEECELIQDKIFVRELVAILAGIDESLYEIVETIRENLDVSLFEIYQMYYADDFSQRIFYCRIKQLRQIITDLSSGDKRSCLRTQARMASK